MPFFRWSDIEDEVITPSHSTAHGANIRGEKIEVGRFFYPPNTGAEPHVHPNEQIFVILTGRMKFRIGDEEGIAGPGEAVLAPPNIEHEIKALDGEVEFINCKDVVKGFSVKHAKWESEPQE